MQLSEKIAKIKQGFTSIDIEDYYKSKALDFIEQWLTDDQFTDYVPQIEYLIESEKWNLLLDCFYQVIPFGTAGRRGPVGIGPNRINIWTIQASAQGHSQYLIKAYQNEAKERGIVIAYDVRAYLRTDEYDDTRLNPVQGLDCKTLAVKAAEVYSANGIKVYTFDRLVPTPELSFMVRELNCVAGAMISASHNPPEFNGKKVMNESGSQMLPPHDEDLVNVVVHEVEEIIRIDYEEATAAGKITIVADAYNRSYLDKVKKISLNDKYRDINIFYSPFHGTCHENAPKIFNELGFKFTMDVASSVPDPKFPTITYNIPNPEVEESYINLIPNADAVGADLIFAADPDADRVGLMSKEGNVWKFWNGNEIGVLMTAYVLEELSEQGKLKPEHEIAKTIVTTNMISHIAESYGVKMTKDLLVGIKYVADIMNKLEEESRVEDFLLGIEESNGSAGASYNREKDMFIPAILISELAAKYKDQGMTIGDYLDHLYEKYGYTKNLTTEIRMPGAEGMSKMAKIQNTMRENKPKFLGDYEIVNYIDRQEGPEFLSETDKVARNILLLDMKVEDPYRSISVYLRPSGTEPKLKIYFEISLKKDNGMSLEEQKHLVSNKMLDLERHVTKALYKIINIDFPDRGFLLFWQLPTQEKLHYFEIEPQLAALKDIVDKKTREQRFKEMIKFLGADPLEKFERAFRAEYDEGVLEYLDLEGIKIS